MKTINIGRDFSDTPWGRYPEDSDVSGERFREEFLVPALKTNAQLEIEIDDAEGYGSSFLDEAFGGLVREGYFTIVELQKNLTIKTTNPEFLIYKNLIYKYISDAVPKKI